MAPDYNLTLNKCKIYDKIFNILSVLCGRFELMSCSRNTLHYFSSVTSQPVKWLWYPYIPFGKITLIEGDPGEGKTAVILDIISRLTKGNVMPGGVAVRKAENVLYEFAEDGGADTIRPRLEKFGADLSRVAYLNGPDIYMSSDKLWNAIQKMHAKAVVFDPFQAFLHDPGDDGKNKGSGIRKIMTEVAKRADKHGCAVILIGHMNKTEGGKQLYRGLGSIEIPAVARSVLLIERLQEGSAVRSFRQIKNSIDYEGDSLNFEINGDGKINWIGPSGDDDENIVEQSRSHRPSPKHDLIIDKMTEWLSESDLTCTEVYERAKDLDIGMRTVNKVKAEMHVKSIRTENGWYWHLDREAKVPDLETGDRNGKKQEISKSIEKESDPGTVQPEG